MMNNDLLPCPLCGDGAGYGLDDGETSRWWRVSCKSCGEQVTECRADTKLPRYKPLPINCPAAHTAWNDAAAYAEKMRIGYVRYETLRKLSMREFRALAENLALRRISGECRVDNLADLVDKIE